MSQTSSNAGLSGGSVFKGWSQLIDSHHSLNLSHHLHRCLFDRSFITAQHPAMFGSRLLKRLGAGNMLFQPMHDRTA